MVIGIDTYHEGKSVGSRRSVGAIVASMNRDLTAYYSQYVQSCTSQYIYILLPLFFNPFTFMCYYFCQSDCADEGAGAH